MTKTAVNVPTSKGVDRRNLVGRPDPVSSLGFDNNDNVKLSITGSKTSTPLDMERKE